MSAAKSKESSSTGSAAARPGMAQMSRGPLRWAMLALLIAAMLGGAWHAVWQMVSDQVTESDHYRITFEDIEISPLPAWIRADVRAEVVRDAGLESPLSLLDAELAGRLHRAFALHPWVAHVNRVVKLPAGKVQIDLVYRRPVCMVEVPGGLFPVDDHGVLLPSADFSPQEASRYPRVAGINPATAGPVGTKWPDPRVIGASGIAKTLLDVWVPWELGRIEPAAASASNPVVEDPGYVVFTTQGTRIFWGSAPGGETAGEGTADAKLAQLKRHLAEHGTLDTGDHDLDLRPVTRLSTRPK